MPIQELAWYGFQHQRCHAVSSPNSEPSPSVRTRSQTWAPQPATSVLESRLCFLRTLPLNSRFTSDGGWTWELLQKGAGVACGMMTRKGWWEVSEDGKHGAQSLGGLYGGVGPWNCPFHAPEGGLRACPYGQGHCGDSGSSWLWKMPPSFTSMTCIPPSRTGDSGSRENGKFQGPNLSVLVSLLFFGHWRESDPHSCMLQTQNLQVCYWGLGRMLQCPPPLAQESCSQRPCSSYLLPRQQLQTLKQFPAFVSKTLCFRGTKITFCRLLSLANVHTWSIQRKL